MKVWKGAFGVCFFVFVFLLYGRGMGPSLLCHMAKEMSCAVGGLVGIAWRMYGYERRVPARNMEREALKGSSPVSLSGGLLLSRINRTGSPLLSGIDCGRSTAERETLISGRHRIRWGA